MHCNATHTTFATHPSEPTKQSNLFHFGSLVSNSTYWIKLACQESMKGCQSFASQKWMFLRSRHSWIQSKLIVQQYSRIKVKSTLSKQFVWQIFHILNRCKSQSDLNILALKSMGLTRCENQVWTVAVHQTPLCWIQIKFHFELTYFLGFQSAAIHSKLLY